MDTRARGDRTEEEIDYWFSKYGITGFSVTSGSGSVNNDGDRRSSEFMREDKYRGSKSFSISHGDFTKAKKQAVRQGLKLLFCVQNSENDVIVAMPIQHFLPLLATWLEN